MPMMRLMYDIDAILIISMLRMVKQGQAGPALQL